MMLMIVLILLMMMMMTKLLMMIIRIQINLKGFSRAYRDWLMVLTLLLN